MALSHVSLGLELLDLLFEAAGFDLQRPARLLPVGAVELLQIARDALRSLNRAWEKMPFRRQRNDAAAKGLGHH